MYKTDDLTREKSIVHDIETFITQADIDVEKPYANMRPGTVK